MCRRRRYAFLHLLTESETNGVYTRSYTRMRMRSARISLQVWISGLGNRSRSTSKHSMHFTSSPLTNLLPPSSPSAQVLFSCCNHPSSALFLKHLRSMHRDGGRGRIRIRIMRHLQYTKSNMAIRTLSHSSCTMLWLYSIRGYTSGPWKVSPNKYRVVSMYKKLRTSPIPFFIRFFIFANYQSPFSLSLSV